MTVITSTNHTVTQDEGVARVRMVGSEKENTMRRKMIRMGMLAAVLAVFATGAVAQHEAHHPEGQAAQPQAQTPSPSQPGTTGPAATGPGMMGGGMMGMMMNMQGQNQQMSATMNKMMENIAAMRNEKDPAKMKAMMAEQSAMLEQMRSQMMQQGGMMQNMSGMMKNCPMMGAGSEPPPAGK